MYYRFTLSSQLQIPGKQREPFLADEYIQKACPKRASLAARSDLRRNNFWPHHPTAKHHSASRSALHTTHPSLIASRCPSGALSLVKSPLRPLPAAPRPLPHQTTILPFNLPPSTHPAPKMSLPSSVMPLFQIPHNYIP